MSARMAGKRVVLTGAAANIGRATALLLADEGASIVIGDLDDKAADTAEAIRNRGGQAWFVSTDVSDTDGVKRLLNVADRKLGGVDTILNNAGVQRSGSITETAEDIFDLHLRVNARSCFLMAKYGVPLLRESDRGPAIVNMASVAGFKAPKGLAAYSASKGAIIALTRTLADELAPDGIRVNALAPGWVDTSFNDPVVAHLGGRKATEDLVRASVPLGRQGTAQEIAEAYLFFASDASSFITGQILTIDGGAL